MRILITGGSGFIGSHLSNLLYKNGHEIFIIDKFNPQIHGANKEESYLYRRVKDIAEVYTDDIVTSRALDELLKQCDYIIHLAAETGTGQSMYEVSNYVRTNTLGTAVILEKLIKNSHNVKKLVLASSRAIYGEGKYHCNIHGTVYPKSRSMVDMKKGDFECKCPICKNDVELKHTDEDSLPNPQSIYGLTKLNQEQLIEQTCRSINLPYTIYRFQNVYGTGQSLNNPYTGILAIFSKQILQGKHIDVFEDGRESRDFIHVDDLSSILAKELFGTSENQIFNIGSGTSTSVLQLIEILRDVLKMDATYKISGSFRIGDIRHNIADISKAKRFLDYNPIVKIEDGIKEFALWLKEQNKVKSEKSFERSLKEMKKHNMFYSNEDTNK